MSSGLFSPPRVNRAVDGWGQRSLRSMLSARGERNRSDLPLLTVARERGVFVRSAEDANHNAIPEDLSNYKVARRGDLVINKMKAWQGSLGLAPVDGIVSPAYFVFSADFAVPEFGEYLLRSKPYVAKFAAASDGVRIGQWDLDIARMREIRVRLPAPGEQTAIVKYLAHANARIDNAIAAKRRLITILEEQRAAVRDKLIEEGAWPRQRLKTLLLRVDQGVSPQAENQVPGPGEWGVVKSGCVNNGRFRADQVKRLPDGFVVPTALCIAEGDLLVSRANGSADLVGSAARVVGLMHQSILSDKTFRLVLRPDIDTDFLAISMNSRSYRQQVLAAISGAEGLGNNLPLSALRRMEFSVPPIDIQRNIVKREHVESRAIERTSNRVSTEILLLEEFRTRLVADVVTGQVDVRAVAETLPDPIMPDVSLDEDWTDLDDLLGHEDD